MGFGFCSTLCKEETLGEKIATIHPHKLGATQNQQNVALMPLLVGSSKFKAQCTMHLLLL